MTETMTVPAPVWRPSPEFIRTSLLYLALGIGVIGAAALALSFTSVAAAAHPYFGDASWVIPVIADVTIAILFFLSISMELNGLRSPLASFGAKALVGFTVYANVAPQHGPYGKVLHGAPPIVWTLTVVIAEGAIRKLVGLSDEKRIEQVRRSLWLLRPLATLWIWRRMRIEQIPSYREALDRDAARGAVVGRLRLNHGRMWRTKAPLAERIALRLEGRDPAGVAKTLKAHGAVVTLLADTTAPKTGSEQRKTERKVGRKSTADAIAALRAKQPELTQVTVANRLKLTDRTVRKYWADTTPLARPAVHAVPDVEAA